MIKFDIFRFQTFFESYHFNSVTIFQYIHHRSAVHIRYIDIIHLHDTVENSRKNSHISKTGSFRSRSNRFSDRILVYSIQKFTSTRNPTWILWKLPSRKSVRSYRKSDHLDRREVPDRDLHSFDFRSGKWQNENRNLPKIIRNGHHIQF